MVNVIEILFPQLAGGGYTITSPATRKYNCIAWAAGDATQWWWPVAAAAPQRTHWPEGVARQETVEAFRLAFVTLGYEICAGEQVEQGFEKVAIFADAVGAPTHAARQLPNGRWTSKLGKREDIEHALHDLAGEIYGSVALVMKRPTPSGEIPPAGAPTSSSAA